MRLPDRGLCACTIRDSKSFVGKHGEGADLVLSPAQSFTKIASEKVNQATDAASKTKDKTTGTSKSVYDSIAANLQSARDASAKQLEDNRAAADQHWAKLQKVLLLHHHKHCLVQRQSNALEANTLCRHKAQRLLPRVHFMRVCAHMRKDCCAVHELMTNPVSEAWQEWL